MNGNPIYSLIRKDKSKALRITQDEPRSNKPYMFCYTDNYIENDDLKIPFLEISLELSNKTLLDSLTLIELWFNDTEKNIFSATMDRINKRYEKNYVKTEHEMAFEAYEEIKELETLKHYFISESNIKKRLDGIIKIRNVYNHWMKDLSKSITNINPDLASAITVQITTLHGLVTLSGHIIISESGSISLRNKSYYIGTKDYYNGQSFIDMYRQLNNNIEDLNDNLLGELAEVEK